MKEVLLLLGLWTVGGWGKETADRHVSYDRARGIADSLNKPLLNIGCPSTRPLGYPCGDVCLDIAPGRLSACRSRLPVLGDVRNLSRFRDKTFGAVTCFHVLEHLATVADAEQSLAELHRVADHVFICSPSRLLPIPWIHPDHRLWVDHHTDGSITFEQRQRGVSAGETMYPLIQGLWSDGEALLRTLRTGTPFDRALVDEREAAGLGLKRGSSRATLR